MTDFQEEPVGHARDVVAYTAMERVVERNPHGDRPAIAAGFSRKNSNSSAMRRVDSLRDWVTASELYTRSLRKRFNSRGPGGGFRAQSRDSLAIAANIVRIGKPGGGRKGAFDKTRNQPVDQSPNHLLHADALGSPGKLHLRRLPQLTKFTYRMLSVLDPDESCAVTVVQIGGIVGDFVAQVDELCFERGPQPRQIFIQLRDLAGRRSRECLTMPSRTSKVRFKPGKRA